MTKSKVAMFREQQAMQEEAALLGLQGLSSGSSRHDFIEKRMERGAHYILGLIQAGKHEEAQALMNSNTWARLSDFDTLEYPISRKEM